MPEQTFIDRHDDRCTGEFNDTGRDQQQGNQTYDVHACSACDWEVLR